MLESLRLYMICKRTRWTHLPNPGGWYQQHPQFVDDCLVVMGIDDEVKAKREKKEREQAEAKSRGRGRPRMRG